MGSVLIRAHWEGDEVTNTTCLQLHEPLPPIHVRSMPQRDGDTQTVLHVADTRSTFLYAGGCDYITLDGRLNLELDYHSSKLQDSAVHMMSLPT